LSVHLKTENCAAAEAAPKEWRGRLHAAPPQHDGFIFHGSECQQLKQVGNAVPPFMALAVARAAEQLLAGVKSKSGRRN
jgi:site-specific DNA-cytosine methylase